MKERRFIAAVKIDVKTDSFQGHVVSNTLLHVVQKDRCVSRVVADFFIFVDEGGQRAMNA